MDGLVEALVFSGLLKTSGRVNAAVPHAIAAAVTDSTLRAHLLEEVSKPRVLPSATTLYKHRLLFA
eukprot:13537548-Alexandrium_andersonii.AAC.1